MALSLKSNLVEYYEEFGTNTGPPTSLDSKGDYGSKFNAVAQYTKQVNIGSEASSPLFNKYPIGFFPDNPLARQPEKFNPNLISISVPKGRFYSKRRGLYNVPKTWKDKQITSDGVHRINDSDTDKASIYNFYTKEQSISPLAKLYDSSQYYGDNLNFRSTGVTTNSQSWGIATDQPYILRGIQRKNAKKRVPQRWGFNVGFDDGLIRGGIVTALDRAAHDALRIGKFLISPKGLLFIVKQVGLQLTNPLVETNFYSIPPLAGPFRRRTRIYNLGLNTLLQVAGNAFGMHMKRWGLLGIAPPVDNPAKYEKVIKDRPDNVGGLDAREFSNRLVGLNSSRTLEIAGIRRVPLGLPWPRLTGLAGPKSVYGIGITRIKRYVDSDRHNEYYTGKEKGINVGKGDSVLAKRYATLSYGKLKETAKDHSEYNDFRTGAFDKGLLPGTLPTPTPFIGNPEVSDYDKNNPITKFGMGDHGKNLYVYRGSNFNGRSDYKEPTGLGDEINKLLVGQDLSSAFPQKRDYVKFQFKDINDATPNTMVFRATFGAITDTFNPNWSAKQYMGRPDSVHVYNSYGRTIAFDFTVYADTRENMKPMWQKLNKLASYTTPEYDDRGRAKSPIMKLTLGDYLVDQPGYLSTFGLSTDATHPWEIKLGGDDEDGKLGMFQLPMIMKINVGYTIINQKLPQRKAFFFGNELGDTIVTINRGTLFETEETIESLGTKWLG